MKNKITKALRAEIAAIAAMLPTDHYSAQTSIKSGSEILEINPEAKDGNGKPLNPKDLYCLPVNYEVNHQRRMESAFKSGGREALKKYISKYLKAGAEIPELQESHGS